MNTLDLTILLTCLNACQKKNQLFGVQTILATSGSLQEKILLLLSKVLMHRVTQQQHLNAKWELTCMIQVHLKI